MPSDVALLTVPSMSCALPNQALGGKSKLTPATWGAVKLQEAVRDNIIGSNMIVRTLIRAQTPRVISRRIFRIPNRPIETTRGFSTANAPAMASSTPPSHASMLTAITSDLDKLAPKFEIDPDQITIIQTPAEFYETLKVGLALFSIVSLVFLSFSPAFVVLCNACSSHIHSMLCVHALLCTALFHFDYTNYILKRH
jgi:hypothetical protein